LGWGIAFMQHTRLLDNGSVAQKPQKKIKKSKGTTTVLDMGAKAKILGS